MADVFDAEKRSDIMRQVKSKKNKSTELRLIEIFKQNGITGWRRNYRRVCGRLLLAWTRLPKHSPCRSSRILAEEARTEHGTRQRSNGHVRGARLDGVADLGVRVEEEKLGLHSQKN